MSATPMYDCTVIGEIYQDHIFSGFAHWPTPGEEIFTDRYEWELGGGAVTTACALARLGRSVHLIGIVGEPDLPRITSRLQDFGVSTSGLVASSLRTGVTVGISTVHDRTFFTHRGANDELPALLLQNDERLQAAAHSRHIHFAMPLTAHLAAHVLPLLGQHGATTSLDVGHHMGWLQDEASLGVLGAITYTMPNAREAALLSGSVEQYLQRCRTLGLRNALVKLGRDGAGMLRNGVEYRVASPDVTVVDTTGAGDAFDAGFIDALLDEKSPVELLEQGCACGALSTRAAGALHALPTREDLTAILQESHAA